MSAVCCLSAAYRESTCKYWAMGQSVGQLVIIVLAVAVAFTILGWLLKALWWVAVVAAGIVVGGLVLGRISRG